MTLFVGWGLALVGIALSTIMDGNSFGPLIGPSSLVLVLLGTLGASFIGFSVADLKQVPKAVKVVLSGKTPDPDEVVTRLTIYADRARREGMLALEAEIEKVEDSFTKAGLQLVVDGVDGEQVKAVLETELDAVEERHQLGIGFFKTAGGYAPTFGMIGTVIGLINMLGNLSDPSQLGIGMSLALLTTLYGVLFSNLFFLPLAAKLTRLHEVEMHTRVLTLEGILAVREGVSSRLLVERLEAHLSPDLRIGYQKRVKGGRAGDPEAKAA